MVNLIEENKVKDFKLESFEDLKTLLFYLV